MLRSFDYAAELSRIDHEQATGDADEHDQALAREWAERNRRGVPRRATARPRRAEVDEVLLDGYAADKAVYEAVYEARNRPAWLPIPLAALRTAPCAARRPEEVARGSCAELALPVSDRRPGPARRRAARRPARVLGAHPHDGGVTVRTLKPLPRR